MPVDHFPSTHATWIDAQLTIAEDGDRAAAAGDPAAAERASNARDALRRHVMGRYATALTAYVSTPQLRRIGERDDLVLAASPLEALRGADALVIVTEWKEFRSPPFDEIRARLAHPVVFDGRNLYDPQVVARHGLEYHSIGRPVPAVPCAT